MTLDLVEGKPSISIEGNLTCWTNIPTLEQALGIAEIKAKSLGVAPILALDVDGPLVRSIAETLNMGYTPERLNQLRSFLIRYPQTSVYILTSRNAEYGWGSGEKWLFQLKDVLATGTNYPPRTIPIHSLAYDRDITLVRRILAQESQKRVIIYGAGKDELTRLSEVLIGLRPLSSFLYHDILGIDPSIQERRLQFALRTIFSTPDDTNKLVVIVDDGVMREITELLAKSSYFGEQQLVYIKMTPPSVGNIPLLFKGALGALASGIRNTTTRNDLRPLNP